MAEHNLIRLKEIETIIKERQDTFGKVMLGFVFSNNEENALKVGFGLINFLRKGETLEEITYNYGKFNFVRRLVNVSKALDIIRSVIKEELLKVDGWKIPLTISLGSINYLPSRRHYGYIASEWPRMYVFGQMDDQTRGEFPRDSLLKLELPLFPNGVEAINVLFGLNISSERSEPDGGIILQVPDYRARITNIRLAENRVTLEVETPELTSTDVRVKVYCKNKNNQVSSSEDLPLEDGRVTYVAADEPLQVEAHIVSVPDGKSLDQREFDYRYYHRYPSRTEGVIIENSEMELLDIIAKGENETVEFKSNLPPRKKVAHRDFLETIVAFSNAQGGTIFVGVDDHCQICGFNEEGVKNRIEDMIAHSCEPAIVVGVETVWLEGIPIVLVTVPEGKDKPYLLNGIIFMRRGASDRKTSRRELDELYANRRI